MTTVQAPQALSWQTQMSVLGEQLQDVVRVRAYKFRLLTVKVKLSAKVPESVLFVL